MTNHFALRLPASIIEQARLAAKQDGVSLNQFIATAVGEKVSALRTEIVLGERAKRANDKKFNTVMKKLGRNNKPQLGDELV